MTIHNVRTASTATLHTTEHHTNADVQPPESTLARRALLVPGNQLPPCPELELYFAHHESPAKNPPLSAEQVEELTNWCIEDDQIKVLVQVLKDNSEHVTWFNVDKTAGDRQPVLEILQKTEARHGVRVNSFEEISLLPVYLANSHAKGLYIDTRRIPKTLDDVSEDLIKALGLAHSLREVTIQALLVSDPGHVGVELIKAIATCPSTIEKLILRDYLCYDVAALASLLGKNGLLEAEIKPLPLHGGIPNKKLGEALIKCHSHSLGTRHLIIPNCPAEVLNSAKQRNVRLTIPVDQYYRYELNQAIIDKLPEHFANVVYCFTEEAEECIQDYLNSPHERLQERGKALKREQDDINNQIRASYHRISVLRNEYWHEKVLDAFCKAVPGAPVFNLGEAFVRSEVIDASMLGPLSQTNVDVAKASTKAQMSIGGYDMLHPTSPLNGKSTGSIFDVNLSEVRAEKFEAVLNALKNYPHADKVNLHFVGESTDVQDGKLVFSGQFTDEQADGLLSALRMMPSVQELSLSFDESADIEFIGKVLAGVADIKKLPQLKLEGVVLDRGQPLSTSEQINGLEKLKSRTPDLKPHLDALLCAMDISSLKITGKAFNRAMEKLLANPVGAIDAFHLTPSQWEVLINQALPMTEKAVTAIRIDRDLTLTRGQSLPKKETDRLRAMFIFKGVDANHVQKMLDMMEIT
jgi:hypothetical protein